MKVKKIIYAVVIVALVIIASYLFTQKSVKEGVVCPPTSPIKQNTQQVATKVQEKVNGNTTKAQKTSTGIKVTFIELGSVGCTPCDMMRPILDEIEKEYVGRVLVRFYDVRTILGSPYAEKYNVRMIPTQVFLNNNGEEYYRHVGFFPKEEIVKILQLRGVK
jgi:thioredoxin 1